MKTKLIEQLARALAKQARFATQLKATGKARLAIPVTIEDEDYDVTVYFVRKGNGG